VAGHSGQFTPNGYLSTEHCDTHYVSGDQTHNLPVGLPTHQLTAHKRVALRSATE